MYWTDLFGLIQFVRLLLFLAEIVYFVLAFTLPTWLLIHLCLNSAK